MKAEKERNLQKNTARACWTYRPNNPEQQALVCIGDYLKQKPRKATARRPFSSEPGRVPINPAA
jgi:hypothetical protein